MRTRQVAEYNIELEDSSPPFDLKPDAENNFMIVDKILHDNNQLKTAIKVGDEVISINGIVVSEETDSGWVAQPDVFTSECREVFENGWVKVVIFRSLISKEQMDNRAEENIPDEVMKSMKERIEMLQKMKEIANFVKTENVQNGEDETRCLNEHNAESVPNGYQYLVERHSPEVSN